MALRALYIIGILRQNGGAPDEVVALTFSRRYCMMHDSHGVTSTSLAVHAQRSCCCCHDLHTGCDSWHIKSDVSGHT